MVSFLNCCELSFAGRQFIAVKYSVEVFNSPNLELKSVSVQNHRSRCQRHCVKVDGIPEDRLVTKFEPRSERCVCLEGRVETLDFVDEVYARDNDVSYVLEGE